MGYGAGQFPACLVECTALARPFLVFLACQQAALIVDLLAPIQLHVVRTEDDDDDDDDGYNNKSRHNTAI